MTRVVRSRRAGLSRDEVRQQPLYARMLGLQNLAPSGFLCFVFLEGAIALGILLALGELVSWWGVLVLPITVAVMVKLNDVVAGMLVRPSTAARPVPDDLSLRRARTVDLRGSVSVPAVPMPSAAQIDAGGLNGPAASRQWAEQLDARQQWARQTATRRYE
jgi:predicted signal transduction protein with EAL and GGDEF domain